MSGAPGTAVALPSVFVTTRSGLGDSVSESVALSLPGMGSVQPAGTVAVAVLANVPVAPGATVPATVRVATAPVSRAMCVDTALPVPEVEPQAPLPLVMLQLQLTPVIAAGTVSSKVAALTFEGPLLVTVTV